MDPARFLALECGRDHQPGDDQHVLHGPAGRVVEFQRQDIAAPAIDLVGGLVQPGGVAGDAHAPPHERAQRLDQIVEVDTGLTVAKRRCVDRRHFEPLEARHASSSATMSSATRAP